MHKAIEVWAPQAESVRVISSNHQSSLRRCEEFQRRGVWQGELPFDSAQKTCDYHLRIDNGPLRPDPRSPWQPCGVHGPSRWLDHSSFQWHDRLFQARPLSGAVIYELHIGTFTSEGTFEAAIARLDHLVELGVTHVELMPVAEFPGDFGWGYDGVCLFAPKHSYGGPTGLKSLIDACHLRGLAVILDVIYNHLGPVGNYLREFGPYFSHRHATPWGEAINFDGPGSDQVRRFFCDNALMWLRDYHFDALRLDAVHAIVDTSAIPFLEQLQHEVEMLSAHTQRHLTLIAESDLNDPRLLRAREAGGLGLSAQWCDDFHHALHTALTGEQIGYYADFGKISGLAGAFKHPYVYAGQYSPARERWHGRSAHGISGHRFVTFAQNHDQIGNRAQGERLGQLVGVKLAKVAAALLFFAPHIPQLFQGEEWNSSSPFLYFADWRTEPALAQAVRQGRQTEFAAFGWRPEQLADASDLRTFQRSRLAWEQLCTQSGQEMFQWYQCLISLRRDHSELTDGRFELVETCYDETQRWLTVRRGALWLVANLGQTSVLVPQCQQADQHRLILRSDRAATALRTEDFEALSMGGAIEIPPEVVFILEREAECRSA